VKTFHVTIITGTSRHDEESRVVRIFASGWAVAGSKAETRAQRMSGRVVKIELAS